ncbi:uncharacterized protein LOC124440952 [Xenia sp. Carnegie-2017]|uniref:uncharacterized protein LOC124440952 n=1 Tax=Xenia sp. Carnegie-2017 TaxID=2897299 RepID=UPI001F03A81D|nr:uncharacterized protein LOC124440952 [Xenia sp. Carnegie-2017]
MFGRQFLRKCPNISNLSYVASRQYRRKSGNLTREAAMKHSKTKANQMRGHHVITMDMNLSFLKQMERFSILRCSAVGTTMAIRSVICLPHNEGVLELAEDEEEACSVKRQSLC